MAVDRFRSDLLKNHFVYGKTAQSDFMFIFMAVFLLEIGYMINA